MSYVKNPPDLERLRVRCYRWLAPRLVGVKLADLTVTEKLLKDTPSLNPVAEVVLAYDGAVTCTTFTEREAAMTDERFAIVVDGWVVEALEEAAFGETEDGL